MTAISGKAIEVLGDARILRVLADELAVRDVRGRTRVLSDPGPDARNRIRTGLSLDLGPDASDAIIAQLDGIGWSASVDLSDERLAATRRPTVLAWTIGLGAPVSLLCLLAGATRGATAVACAVSGTALALLAGRALERRRRVRVATRERVRWDHHFTAEAIPAYAWSEQTTDADGSAPSTGGRTR